jgi:RNA polymerase sigma-70 factor (ECF subfamily)
MDEGDRLAQRFETHRAHLRAVAYRILGSPAEAEDAVQEAWLRLSRSDTSGVQNLVGWLTTVVARVCLDMLRSRRSRREEAIGLELPEPLGNGEGGIDPEDEAVLADSVGRALLVVLGTLAPAERIAFVLHDTFAVPFDEIAPILARSPAAAKKLASRARRRVHGRSEVPDADLARHRGVVDAFLAAVRGGDMNALLAVLDPDVVRRTDPVVLPSGAPTQVRGAHHVLREAPGFSRHARFAEPALVNGALGALVAPRGQLILALTFAIKDDKIVEFEVIAEPARLDRLDLAVLDRRPAG